MSDEIGRDLAVRSIVKNCGVCRLGYNIVGMIQRELVNGAPYSDVHRTLVEMEVRGIIKKAPSVVSVTNHAKKHMGVKDMAIRKHLELRATQRNIDILNGVQNILTDISVAELMVQAGHRLLSEGKMEITAKDLLTANKQVHDFLKEETGSQDVAQMTMQVGFILQAVKEITTEDQWVKITNRVTQLANSDIEDAILEEDDEEDEED